VSQLEAFCITIGIEVLVAMGMTTLISVPSIARLSLAVVLGTVLTHPLLWAVADRIPSDWWWPAIFALEVVIGVVEGVVVVVMGRVPWRGGLLIGVIMNAVSFGLGLLLAPLWT
jgi:hypothetical protein